MKLTEKYIGKTPEELHSWADSLKKEYISGHPYPHIAIDNFFKPDMLDEVLAEFPDMQSVRSVKFNNAYERKLASEGEYLFGEKSLVFMHFLNSQPMLEFLEKLTGIENILPDPEYVGGGYHEIKPGGFLKIHADFNIHPVYNYDRRINLLVYLNKDWKEEYGGHFELWDKQMKGCEKKILPLYNRFVVFSTTSDSYHGHPNPLTCPEDRSRRSLALYYYTNGRPEEETNVEHTTLFKQRPDSEDSQDFDGNSFKVKAIKQAKKYLPPIIYDAIRKVAKGE